MKKKNKFLQLFMKSTFILVLSLIIAFTIKAKTTGEKYKTSNDDSDARIRVALLLDTSSSMDGLIEQAKSQLWSIVNKLSEAKIDGETPILDIALYEYGNDRLTSSSGYIKQIIPFSHDLDDISEKLFALSTNGGSEYCPMVIKSSLDDLYWGGNRKNINLIFIAGNETFDQGPISIKSATNLAKNKGVTINTIFCGDFDQGMNSNWTIASKFTGGNYTSINHNSKTQYIATPYDELIVTQNNILNSTYIPYGVKGRQKLEKQNLQDLNASSYGKMNSVNRTISKSKRVYNNSSWDLVDGEKGKSFSYKDIDKSTLPKDLKKLDIEGLKKYVDEKRTERTRVQKEISKLNQKRKEFIKAQKELNSDNNNLEDALINTIEKQARKKGYTFN